MEAENIVEDYVIISSDNNAIVGESITQELNQDKSNEVNVEIPKIDELKNIPSVQTADKKSKKKKQQGQAHIVDLTAIKTTYTVHYQRKNRFKCQIELLLVSTMTLVATYMTYNMLFC